MLAYFAERRQSTISDVLTRELGVRLARSPGSPADGGKLRLLSLGMARELTG
jgi:hypothetical protein